LKDHPRQDAWLVIEVSDSSLAQDREVKAHLYAEVGVPEYWIVNVVDRATRYGLIRPIRQSRRATFFSLFGRDV